MWRWIMVLVCWLMVTPAWAAAPTVFAWDRNTEADLDHYNIWTCGTSATCIPSVKLGETLQPAVGVVPTFAIPVNTQGRAAITAVDLVGNESGQSNVVSFDKQAPLNPLNLRLQ